jgi:creatinine amidohydrolase
MAYTALERLNRDEIGDRAPSAVAVMPTAAIEQHGPHNPVGLDTMCCMAVARGAAEAAGEVDVIVSPPLHFGSSDHHRPFPGVLSLRSGTFSQVLYEVVESLALSGFRRILILNGHGGNILLIQQVARDFVLVNPDARVAAAAYWDIARPRLEAVEADRPVSIPGHGGDFETALMLHLVPELVRSDLVPVKDADRDDPRNPQSLLPTLPPRSSNVSDILYGSFPGARITGLSDDAGAATADLGRQYYNIAVEETAALICSLVE